MPQPADWFGFVLTLRSPGQEPGSHGTIRLRRFSFALNDECERLDRGSPVVGRFGNDRITADRLWIDRALAVDTVARPIRLGLTKTSWRKKNEGGSHEETTSQNLSRRVRLD